MGMTAFEIFGILKLDKSDFDKGLSSARSDAKTAGSAISGGVSALGNGLVTAAKVGAAAVGAATTAAVAFGKSAVSAASEYESAFTGVRKTVDATEAEYEQLSNWIMDASTKMASSQEVIAGTMEIAGQLGIRGVEGLETFTETMIMLGDTTNLNAEEAASALAKFGNIAGLEAKDMDRIGSVIVDLGNNFATTEADIVGMSTRLASAGTIAGFSATDILALSTAMSSVGINAEAGGTAMSTIMTKIGRAVDSGGDKLELFAATAGMTAEEFAAMWKSTPTEALQGFVKGLDGMIDSGGNVTAVLDDLGIKGIRETNTIKSLALASDVLTGAVDMANKAFDENNALQNEANLRYGTTESQMQQMANSFKNLRIAIGEELKPMYGELMSFSTGAIQAMQQGFEEGGLEGLMGSLGTAISDGLNMLNGYLPELVNAGMSLIGALGQGIIDNAPQIFDSIMQIGGQVSQAVLGLMQTAAASIAEFDWVGTANDIATFLTDALTGEGAQQFLQSGVDILTGLASGIGDSLPILLPAAIDAVASLGEFLAQEAPNLIGSAVDLILKLVEGLTNPDSLSHLLDSALQLILSLADGLVAAIPRLLEALPTIIQNLVTTLISLAPKLLMAAVELIVQLEMGLIKNIPSLVRAVPELLGALVSAIINGLGELVKSGKRMVESIKDGITSLDPVQWGKDMISGFIEGIKNMIGRVKDAATSVADAVKGILGFSEPDEGPLSNFHTFAPDMMKLFASGIRDNMGLVEGAVKDTALAIGDGLDISAEPTYNIGKAGGSSDVQPTSFAPVINIYGAEGQDVNDLADAVSERLQHLYDRGVAAYA